MISNINELHKKIHDLAKKALVADSKQNNYMKEILDVHAQIVKILEEHSAI